MCAAALLIASVLVASTSAFDIKDCIVDAALVIDNSASITDYGAIMQNWEFMLQFAQDLAKGINVGPTNSHVGLVDFHSYATTHFTLDQYPAEEDVVKAIGALPYVGGQTNTPEGLMYGRELLTNSATGARDDVTKLMFVITDGEPSSQFVDQMEEEIRLTKAENIRIIAIGVTAQVKVETLESMASSDSDVYIADSFDKMQSILDSVLNENTCKPPPEPPVVDEDSLISSCDAI
jgi:uncharacterized protein YegL